MQENLFINDELNIPGDELVISASRASGPGGQHVNKTNSRISLRWNVAASAVLNEQQRALIRARLRTRLVGEEEILIHVDSERSQLRNREIARERLATLVRDALRPQKKRKASKPSQGAKNRRMDDKKQRGLIKKLRRVID